jgi:hypothetical protein
MNLDQLLKTQVQFTKDAASLLASQTFDPDSLQRPLELQQQQAQRLEERIAALEDEKVAVAARIDAELSDLKSELEARRKQMGADQQSPLGVTKPPPGIVAAPALKAPAAKATRATAARKG